MMNRGALRWVTPAALALLIALPMGGAAAFAVHRYATANVLAIYQSPGNVTEQSALTVHVKLADATGVRQVFFTFCQLTNSLCYLPVVMVAQGGNWFVGTTHPMTSYSGMTVGVRGGYNITIGYNNNTNVTEPSLPNQFANLTIVQSVTGSYYFGMVVSDHVYALQGTVYSQTSGAAVAGANVTLSPGARRSTTTNASGGYAFAGLSNGTYTVLVTQAGYATSSVSVAIAGQSIVKDVQLSGESSDHGVTHPNAVVAFLTSAGGIGLLAVVAAILILVVVLAVSRSRKRKGDRAPSAAGTEEPTRNDPA